MRAISLLALLSTLLSAKARAQDVGETSTDSSRTISVTVSSPKTLSYVKQDDSDEYACADGSGSDKCVPLNAALCEAILENATAAEDIELTLKQTEQASDRFNTTTDSRFYAWIETSSGSCETNMDSVSEDARLVWRKDLDGTNPTNGNPSALLTHGGTFTFSAGNVTLEGGVLSTAMLFEQLTGACTQDGDGKQNGVVRICFAIDGQQTGDATVDDISPTTYLSYDHQGWITFPVDTRLPDKPTIVSYEGANEKLKLKVELGKNNSDDVKHLVFRYRKVNTDDDNDYPENCTKWEDIGTLSNEVEKAYEEGDTEFTLDAEAGHSYVVCAMARDHVFNLSLPTDLTEPIESVDETDFAEGFPGDLEAGYCGATAGIGLMPLCTALLLLMRGSRRRRS